MGHYAGLEKALLRCVPLPGPPVAAKNRNGVLATLYGLVHNTQPLIPYAGSTSMHHTYHFRRHFSVWSCIKLHMLTEGICCVLGTPAPLSKGGRESMQNVRDR